MTQFFVLGGTKGNNNMRPNALCLDRHENTKGEQGRSSYV